MLKTRRRYKMCGCDFSAQEVRVFAANCKDPAMLKAYKEGKDLYSEVASMVYGVPYDECREFRSDGTFNLEGKQRRTACKSLILGLMYGRGIGSIAEQIKKHKGPVTKEDKDEARMISDKFFNSYPGAKRWIDETHAKVKRDEYVEDLWGRRRRLPDINLPKYTFESIQDDSNNFNPLMDSPTAKKVVTKEIIDKYTQLLDRTFNVEKRKEIIDDALKYDKVKITNNNGFIAQAERQSVNAIIQGGSATITKLAIRNMCNNQELKQLDFHLLVPVHDEVIAEAPLWNIDRCNEIMGQEMCNAAKPECVVEMKTDGDTFDCWYEDVASAHIIEDYEKSIKAGTEKDIALQEVVMEYSEFTEDEIKKYLSLQ